MIFDLLDLEMLSEGQMMVQFHMLENKEGKDLPIRAPVRLLPHHFVVFTIE